MLLVINFTEDGLYTYRIEKEEFLEKLNNQYFGENPKFLSAEDMKEIYEFHWPLGLLVIEGEIVQPKPISVVKEFTLD